MFLSAFPELTTAIGIDNSRRASRAYRNEVVPKYQLDPNRFIMLPADMMDLEDDTALQSFVTQRGKIDVAFLQNPKIKFREDEPRRLLHGIGQVLSEDGKLIIVIEKGRRAKDGNPALLQCINNLSHSTIEDTILRPYLFGIRRFGVSIYIIPQEELIKLNGELHSGQAEDKNTLGSSAKLDASDRRFRNWGRARFDMINFLVVMVILASIPIIPYLIQIFIHLEPIERVRVLASIAFIILGIWQIFRGNRGKPGGGSTESLWGVAAVGGMPATPGGASPIIAVGAGVVAVAVVVLVLVVAATALTISIIRGRNRKIEPRKRESAIVQIKDLNETGFREFKIEPESLFKTTDLDVHYWQDREKLKAFKKQAGKQKRRKNYRLEFQIQDVSGIWIPLYYDGEHEKLVIFARLLRHKVQDDYFIFRMSVEPTETPLGGQVRSLNLGHERLWYFAHRHAPPVPVRIPGVELSDEALDGLKLKGFIRAALSAARLFYYYLEQLGKRPWSIWAIEPDVSDADEIQAVAQSIILPEEGVEREVIFKRTRKRAQVPDLLGLDRRGKGMLIAEFGMHTIRAQTWKNINGITASRILAAVSSARMRRKPKRILLYTDAVTPGEGHKDSGLPHNEAQEKEVNRYIALREAEIAKVINERKPDIAERQFVAAFNQEIENERSRLRKFLYNIQQVIDDIAEKYKDVPQKYQLPVRLVYIVNHAFRQYEHKGKSPVVVSFRKNKAGYYDLEEESLKLLPRLDDLGAFLSEVATRWAKDIAATRKAGPSTPSENTQSTTKKAPGTQDLTRKQAKFIDKTIKEAKKKPLPQNDKDAMAELILAHPEHRLLFDALLKNEKIILRQGLRKNKEAKVKINLLNCGQDLGFYRNEHRFGRPVYEKVTYQQGKKDIIVNINITQGFRKEATINQLAQLVLHPLFELALGFSHTQANNEEVKYNSSETKDCGVSDLNSFILEHAMQDNDIAYLEDFKWEHENDPQDIFKYETIRRLALCQAESEKQLRKLWAMDKEKREMLKDSLIVDYAVWKAAWGIVRGEPSIYEGVWAYRESAQTKRIQALAQRHVEEHAERLPKLIRREFRRRDEARKTFAELISLDASIRSQAQQTLASAKGKIRLAKFLISEIEITPEPADKSLLLSGLRALETKAALKYLKLSSRYGDNLVRQTAKDLLEERFLQQAQDTEVSSESLGERAVSVKKTQDVKTLLRIVEAREPGKTDDIAMAMFRLRNLLDADNHPALQEKQRIIRAALRWLIQMEDSEKSTNKAIGRYALEILRTHLDEATVGEFFADLDVPAFRPEALANLVFIARFGQRPKLVDSFANERILSKDKKKIDEAASRILAASATDFAVTSLFDVLAKARRPHSGILGLVRSLKECNNPFVDRRAETTYLNLHFSPDIRTAALAILYFRWGEEGLRQFLLGVADSEVSEPAAGKLAAEARKTLKALSTKQGVDSLEGFSGKGDEVANAKVPLMVEEPTAEQINKMASGILGLARDEEENWRIRTLSDQERKDIVTYMDARIKQLSSAELELTTEAAQSFGRRLSNLDFALTALRNQKISTDESGEYKLIVWLVDTEGKEDLFQLPGAGVALPAINCARKQRETKYVIVLINKAYLKELSGQTDAALLQQEVAVRAQLVVHEILHRYSRIKNIRDNEDKLRLYESYLNVKMPTIDKEANPQEISDLDVRIVEVNKGNQGYIKAIAASAWASVLSLIGVSVAPEVSAEEPVASVPEVIPTYTVSSLSFEASTVVPKMINRKLFVKGRDDSGRWFEAELTTLDWWKVAFPEQNLSLDKAKEAFVKALLASLDALIQHPEFKDPIEEELSNYDFAVAWERAHGPTYHFLPPSWRERMEKTKQDQKAKATSFGTTRPQAQKVTKAAPAAGPPTSQWVFELAGVVISGDIIKRNVPVVERAATKDKAAIVKTKLLEVEVRMIEVFYHYYKSERQGSELARAKHSARIDTEKGVWDLRPYGQDPRFRKFFFGA
jgi:hypothetical protein